MLKTDCLNMYTICVKIKLSKKEGMMYPDLLQIKGRLALSVPDDGDSRNASSLLILMSIFLLLVPYYRI